MNTSLQHLSKIASKDSRTIIGLMSGTSMDGLDLALCRISGNGSATQAQLLEFNTVGFSKGFKKLLQEVVSVEKCSLQDVCLMNSRIGDFFGDAILGSLKEWKVKPADVDCVASHGQTIYHAPISKHQKTGFSNSTLQIGDGDHIARKTGILTISDFRQKHTAAGGEGAPLVAPVDELLYWDPKEFRLFLNIGGIANFTYLPPAKSKLNPITTDTGPGNTLMDETARRILKQPFDKNGETAGFGSVNEMLLDKLKGHRFFSLEIPKTTGPELFNWIYIKEAVEEVGAGRISAEDLLATLSQFTANTIAESIRKVHQEPSLLHIYISGGGMHNSFLVELLEDQLDNVVIKSFEKMGFNPDAKEAVCFAVLANETLSGGGFSIDAIGQAEKVNFGKVSFPQ